MNVSDKPFIVRDGIGMGIAEAVTYMLVAYGVGEGCGP